MFPFRIRRIVTLGAAAAAFQFAAAQTAPVPTTTDEDPELTPIEAQLVNERSTSGVEQVEDDPSTATLPLEAPAVAEAPTPEEVQPAAELAPEDQTSDDLLATEEQATALSSVLNAADEVGASLSSVVQSTLSWTSAALGSRLGPTFLALNPGAADTRPTLFKPTSKSRPGGYPRTNPYELGSTPATDGDYWSDSGQVAYIPDNPSTDPGLARIQTFAYYDRVYAISPRLDWASGKPNPDPQTREPAYVKLAGGTPKQPVAMVRNYGMQQNEALVVYKDGLFAVAGTQTSRNSSERPYPGFVFPSYKVPTGLAVTTANEFALVTIWDIQAKKGQLAVVALEAKFLPFHTWPYMGLPNQGSFSAFKLLGYIDLPMSMPSAVSAASNGWWSGPSQTGNKVLSQIKLSESSSREAIYSGGWQGVVAKNGYAMVISQQENKAAIVDLAPLFRYFRESYLSSSSSFQTTVSARGTGATAFPKTFPNNAAAKPVVVWQANVTKPTTVLAGMRLDRWSKDFFKGYIAQQDGTIRIIDTSSLMARNSYERKGTLREVGTFKVGRNPVSMVFTRHLDTNLPLLPKDSAGKQRRADPLNNTFYVACRGEREVVAAVTYEGDGAVYRRIRDKRMGDPVAVSVAVRGHIVTVADYNGKQILSFRIGTIYDARNNKVYKPGADGKAPFELGGQLSLPGKPFLVNSSNVN